MLKNPNSYVFHTIEWKDILENSFNYKPFYIVAKDDNDNICAVFPLFYIKNLAGRRLESLPYSIYGGLLGGKKYVRPLIQKTFELKKELNCDYIVIRQPPNSNTYGNLLEELGMIKNENRLNQYLIMKDPKVLWKEIRSSNRRAIRKARKNNVIVKRVTKEQEIEELYTLEIITRKRFGIPTPSIKYYKNMWNKLYPNGYLEIFIAMQHEKAIASAVFFNFKNRVMYVYGSSTTEGRNLGTNNLLLWNAIEWSYQQGYTIFDFGATPGYYKGSVLKDFKGLYFFKCSFNTSNVPYSWYYFPRYIRNMDPLADPNILTKLGEKFFQKAPICLSKKIGTFIIIKFL